MVTHQLQVERRTGKVRQSETGVLPLCYATNLRFCRFPNVTEFQVRILADLFYLMFYCSSATSYKLAQLRTRVNVAYAGYLVHSSMSRLHTALSNFHVKSLFVRPCRADGRGHSYNCEPFQIRFLVQLCNNRHRFAWRRAVPRRQLSIFGRLRYRCGFQTGEQRVGVK